MIRSVVFKPTYSDEAIRFVEVALNRWLPVQPVELEPTDEQLIDFVNAVESYERPCGTIRKFYVGFSTRWLVLNGMKSITFLEGKIL